MRALRYILVTVVAIIALLIGTVLVLAGTSGGFAWLAENADTVVPGELRIREPQGNLLNTMRTAELSYELGGFSAVAQNLNVRLNWLALLAAEVRLSRVSADSLNIMLVETDTERSEGLPDIKLPIALRIVEGEITTLRFTGAGLDEQLDDLRVSAAMRGRRLQVRELRARIRGIAVQLGGRIRFAGDWPLELEAQWQQLEGLQLAGSGNAAGDLRELSLTQLVQLPEQVTIAATVSELIGTPRVEAVARWDSIALPFSAAGSLLVRSGELSLNGWLDDYAAVLAAEFLPPDLPGGQLDLAARGTTEALRFDALTLRTMNGTVTGAGNLQFATQALALDLQAEALDLTALQANLPQQFAAKISLQGELPDRFKIDVQQAAFEQADLSVAATGQFAWANDTLTASKLRFDAADNHLELDGRLWPNPGVDFELEAPGLEQLLPSAAGSLTAAGRIANPFEQPDVTLTLRGQGLRWEAFEAGSVRADLKIDGQNALQLTLSGEALGSADSGLADVQLDASGVLDNFAFSLLATGTAGRVALAGSAAIRDESLSVNATSGEVAPAEWEAWQLDEELRLSLKLAGTDAPLAAELSAHCWRASEASLCIDASTYRAEQLNAAARLRNLNLAVFSERLGTNYEVVGVASADVSVAGTVASPVAKLAWSQQGTQLNWRDAEGKVLGTQLPEVELQAALANNALTYVASVRGAEGIDLGIDGSTGRLQGASTPLTARLRVAVPELARFAPAIERYAQLQEAAGRLQAELDITGTVGAPYVTGDGRLTEGRAEVPATGIELSSIDLHVRGEGERRMFVDGSARSGAGQVKLEGEIMWPVAGEATASLNVTGENFEALRFPQQTLSVSPDLKLQLDGSDLIVTGVVFVPAADIEIESLPTTAATPSSDVVVIRDTAQAETRRSVLRIISDLAVTLGDDVQFTAFGLVTRLGGSVQLSTTAENQQPSIEGSLRSIDGTFAAYGRELKIERGVLIFAGIADNPNVDVRAARSLRYEGRDIKIGVQLTGPLNEMQTRLFGEPAMSESDALSYLVLNRPMQRSDSLDSAQLSGAAVALGMVNLLPVTEQVRGTLGLDEIKFEGTTEESSSIVAGKRFGDDFYIRYSYGLFDRIGRFIVRYDVGRGFSLEAGSGQEQTIDLLYSIDR